MLHRRGDRAIRIGAGKHLAEHIPQAIFIELDGDDHWAFAGDRQAVLDRIRPFVGELAASVVSSAHAARRKR